MLVGSECVIGNYLPTGQGAHMAKQTLTVHTAFLPASAQRTFHVSCKVGDVLVVEKEHIHGWTTYNKGVLCFVLEEEVYKYCNPKTLPSVL